MDLVELIAYLQSLRDRYGNLQVVRDPEHLGAYPPLTVDNLTLVHISPYHRKPAGLRIGG